MPMVYLEWNADSFTLAEMTALGEQLEAAVRNAIKVARSSVNHEYGVLIRGQEQPEIAINLPDLEVQMEYHKEWCFTDDELDTIVDELSGSIETYLEQYDCEGLTAKLRLYARMGYKGLNLQIT